MTITQLQYIIAVGTHKHFGRAAEASFVTQPTLSMQIQKLEDELGVIIFDRNQHPIETTATGKVLIVDNGEPADRQPWLLANAAFCSSVASVWYLSFHPA